MVGAHHSMKNCIIVTSAVLDVYKLGLRVVMKLSKITWLVIIASKTPSHCKTTAAAPVHPSLQRGLV